MDVDFECGACATLLLTRTLALRTPAWRRHLGPVLAETAALMANASHPGAILDHMYTLVQDRLHDGDAYRDAKDEANRRMEAWWAAHPLPLDDLAGRMLRATQGNAIDAGVDTNLEAIWTKFEAAVGQRPGRDDRDRLLRWMSVAKRPRVLYLLDNAGEAVLDRECIRSMVHAGARVTAVVRGGPLTNDMTRREAGRIGLSDVAEVIDTGGSAYGLIPGRVPESLWDWWRHADLVVAKGLAHLETLSHELRAGPTLFAYVAKCPPSARILGVAPDSAVIWWRDASRAAN
jgi:uncharacterized protein with ATP-grasp and redox domains